MQTVTVHQLNKKKIQNKNLNSFFFKILNLEKCTILVFELKNVKNDIIKCQ